MKLCRYKNIFGETTEETYSLGFLTFFLIDVLITIVLALTIKFLFGGNIYLILFFLFLRHVYALFAMC